MWPHRRQPTRPPHPWDSPGKNTGVGCHFLLQGMKVKSQSEVAQSCPTPSDPMDCSLPGSSIYVIFQARILERGAIAFSRDIHVYVCVYIHTTVCVPAHECIMCINIQDLIINLTTKSLKVNVLCSLWFVNINKLISPKFYKAIFLQLKNKQIK